MISVIIPCYNVEKFLDKCFESLKKQTYKDFELIFINDGSKDNTLEILEEIKNNNSEINIEIINQENAGVSAARNAGLRIAKGEYISFVDPDDSVSEKFLEVLLYGMDQGADISIVGFQKSNESASNYEISKYPLNKEQYFYDLFLKKNIIGYPWNKIYKAEILQRNNIFFDEKLYLWEDLEFNVRYSRYINKAYVTNERVYYYVIHEQGTNNQHFTEKTLNILKSLDKMLTADLNDEEKEIVTLSKCRAVIFLLRRLYKTGTDKKYVEEEQYLVNILHTNKKLFIKKGRLIGNKNYLLLILFAINTHLFKFLLKHY